MHLLWVVPTSCVYRQIIFVNKFAGFAETCNFTKKPGIGGDGKNMFHKKSLSFKFLQLLKVDQFEHGLNLAQLTQNVKNHQIELSAPY